MSAARTLRKELCNLTGYKDFAMTFHLPESPLAYKICCVHGARVVTQYFLSCSQSSEQVIVWEERKKKRTDLQNRSWKVLFWITRFEFASKPSNVPWSNTQKHFTFWYCFWVSVLIHFSPWSSHCQWGTQTLLIFFFLNLTHLIICLYICEKSDAVATYFYHLNS